MANNKMLIDASHPEETRVVVLRGNRVQEFDFEAADKKPLRGNIYLAKVTRVEPSLQAAFVDYGGNRHGFLAFAEIHPDYYQIPVADRLALLEEESRAHRQAEEEDHRSHGRGRRSRRRNVESAEKRVADDDNVISEVLSSEAEVPSSQAEEGEPGFDEALGEREARDEAARQEPSDRVEGANEGPVASDEPNAPTGDEASAPNPETTEPLLAPAQSAPNAELSGEASDAGAEISIVSPPASDFAGYPISVDPEGFGVVETGATEDQDIEELMPDHETKARRQDERDLEHESLEHESLEHESLEYESLEHEGEQESERPEARRGDADDEQDDLEEDQDDEADHVEHIGGDAMEELPYRQTRPRRQYKIQEVIKRRQVLLVQVVKEERGNKGAALTTYLSLAGRYSVLMPNTARGGGISRKITDAADRKRLKEIVHDLEVPEGMGVILRTAGATRTKAEVKRDFEYLLRMWESVRELTLRSSAPTLVYEEGSLIKRAIRDLYGREVEEVIVSGEAAYREAKDFMRMLIPSHAKNVKLYREPTPIFAEAGAEAQLDAMFSNHVTLRSGGYLVINQTEALVAIDVNSGRSTREHNIEDTALRTNLEAADEVARQLRLRDLAGLIVVDFIDMEEGRNNRAVERRLKDALKNDRARIQVGRISHFGLLEMSRQRIRAGVLEGSTVPCPHCAGAGTVRSTSSIALHVLRVLEDALIKSAAHDITLRTRTIVALYILNQKRSHLQELEKRFGVAITLASDDSLTGTAYHALERGELAAGVREERAGVQPLRVDSLRAGEPFEDEETVEEETETQEAAVEEGEGEQPRESFGRREDRAPRADAPEEESEIQQRSRRRRRRRGRGGGQNGIEPAALGADQQPSDEGLAFMARIDGAPAPTGDGQRGLDRGGRRGRGRRPGRWTRSTPLAPEYRDQGVFPVDEGAEEAAAFVSPAEAHMPVFEEPAPQSGSPIEEASFGEAPEAAPSTVSPPAVEAEPAPMANETPPPPAREQTQAVITEADPNRPKRGGWWQRAKVTLGGN